MADVFLSVRSNKPGASEITLINGQANTGYRYLDSDLGNVTWDKVFSGQRGTQGARLVGATAQNRLSTWTLEVVGASKDEMNLRLSVLHGLDEELRRFGGTATWRQQGSSFRQHLDVLDSGLSYVSFDWLEHHENRIKVTLGLVTPPYFKYDDFDIFDDFSSDTEANYTFDTGSAADVAVSGGLLTSVANPTVAKRLIHTDHGYNYGDHQVTLKATPGSTISGFVAGAVLKRVDALNFLQVQVTDDGANSFLRIHKFVAGTPTQLVTVTLGSRIANGVPFWVRGRIEANVVYAEYFTTVPSPTSTPTSSTSTTLAGADLTQFGAAVTGRAGIAWLPQHASAVLDDFTVAPFTWRLATTPTVIRFNGPIPGDAPALGTLEVSIATPATFLFFALAAWVLRTGASAPFGIIEAETGGSLTNWAVTADANYRGGSGLKWTTSGAGSAGASFTVDPSQLVADDYGEEVAVEVWGRVELASTLASPKLLIQGNYPASATFYTEELGNVGKSITLPSSGTVFRFVRLGILRLNTKATSFALQVQASVVGGSSGQFGLDYLVLCPANARALTPTGRSVVSYPGFLESFDATKRVLPDGAGRLRSGASLVDSPDSGLGGSLLELPVGQIDLLFRPSNLIPDDPSASASGDLLSCPATIHLAVTPRGRLGRSS